MGIYRGDIYYIEKAGYTGSEQEAGRPAIIVSNDQCNQYSPTVEVVYLTTQPKTDLPTHVVIRSTRKESTALCEQIDSISTSRIGDFIGTATDDEMERINTALMISLDLYVPTESKELPMPPLNDTSVGGGGIQVDYSVSYGDFVRIEAERDVYKTICDRLFDLMFCNGKKN